MSRKKKKPNKAGAVALSEDEAKRVAAGDATFDNLVGFYEIADTSGGIDVDRAKQTSFANAAYRLGHT